MTPDEDWQGVAQAGAQAFAHRGASAVEVGDRAVDHRRLQRCGADHHQQVAEPDQAPACAHAGGGELHDTQADDHGRDRQAGCDQGEEDRNVAADDPEGLADHLAQADLGRRRRHGDGGHAGPLLAIEGGNHSRRAVSTRANV
jgi:hypothetical protein